MGERLRVEAMFACPECHRYVKPHIAKRYYIERETTAVTLPEFPLDSGVTSTRSLERLTVTCPMDGCAGRWDVWPDEAGL